MFRHLQKLCWVAVYWKRPGAIASDVLAYGISPPPTHLYPYHTIRHYWRHQYPQVW